MLLVGISSMFAMTVHAQARYSIVYVHLGSTPPIYLYDSLVQARLFNREAPICLIANQQALIAELRDFACNNHIALVPCESLVPTESHKLFARSTTLDNRWRDGFWKKACERFFYIHEYMAQYGVNNVCHIESDNLLYVDIADIWPVLERYAGIGAVFDHDGRCIPSFMYIAHVDAMADLVRFIASHAKKGMTDMHIIALYRKERERHYIDYLPIIMREYVDKYPLKSTGGDTPLDSTAYYRNDDTFQSIFDGAAIGQYLGGIDPRNGVSKPGFINETCLFNPAHLDIQWIEDTQGRKVPYAMFGGRKYRINNLHIHSKRLYEFLS